MERFHNTIFGFTHSMIGSVTMHMRELNAEAKNQVVRGQQEGVAQILEGYLSLNAALDIPMTKLAAQRLIATLNDPACTLTVQQIWDAVEEVFMRLWDELEKGGYFFYIPVKRATLFEAKEPFGPPVSAKFPQISEDIEEAHKCYACARYTACVFHLMRVMEVAVQKLGKKLGIKGTHGLVWQTILDQINAAIKALPPKKPRTKKLAAVASNLYNVKLAWRNEVMHPKATYTEEEAANLLAQVKVFMAEVANVV